MNGGGEGLQWRVGGSVNMVVRNLHTGHYLAPGGTWSASAGKATPAPSCSWPEWVAWLICAFGFAFLAVGYAIAVDGQEAPPAAVEVLAGAGVSLAQDSAVLPVARFTIDAPIYLGRSAPVRLRGGLQLHGTPGQAVDVADVTTFQGGELQLEIEHEIGRGRASYTYVVAHSAGATRRDALGERPRERFPIWWGAGVAAEHRERGLPPERRLLVSLGRSQLCHPEGGSVPRDLLLRGHVTVARPRGAVVVLAGEVHRPLWGDGGVLFRVETLAGWGKGK